MASRNFSVSDAPRYRCYVGNLPKQCIASNIETIFEGCKITDIHMVRSQDTDEFRGFAYVEFKDAASYATALACNQMLVNGLELKVNDAERKGGMRGGPGGGRGGPRGGGGNNYPRGGGGRDFGGQGRDFGGQGRDFGGQGRDFGGQGRDFGGQGPRQSTMRGGPVGMRGGGNFGGYDKPRGMGVGSTGGYRPKVQQSFDDQPDPMDSKDRPRLSLKPRTAPPATTQATDRELSDRAKSIFGVGKPRTASPSRLPEENPNSEN